MSLFPKKVDYPFKGPTLWHFSDLGQSCAHTSSCAHMLSGGKTTNVG